MPFVRSLFTLSATTARLRAVFLQGRAREIQQALGLCADTRLDFVDIRLDDTGGGTWFESGRAVLVRCKSVMRKVAFKDDELKVQLRPDCWLHLTRLSLLSKPGPSPWN